jgi:hypothetical protein
MVKTVSLIGCGNIGSRHLQAIAKLDESLEIHIVEPKREARQLAKNRLDEVLKDLTKHRFYWHNDIIELKNSSDVTIVATSASNRISIISQLLELGHLKFLVEKMVCQSTEEYKILIEKMNSFGAIGWVNVPRRYFSSYRNIKRIFSNNLPIHIFVTGGNFGLGSNALHFIDLFSWFVNDYQIKLNGDFLAGDIFPNKRGSEFVEFGGMIRGVSCNSTIVINALSFEKTPLTVSILNNEYNFIISETTNHIFDVYNPKNSTLDFQVDYVSNTTGQIIKEILEAGSCELPTIKELEIAHTELFRIFNLHMYNVKGIRNVKCPIT